MTTRTKIEVHVGILSMEFKDNLVQFNIFEAMNHPIEDHSLFCIDIIDELVKEYMPIDIGSSYFFNFVEIPEVMNCFNSVEDDLSDFMDYIVDLVDLVNIFEFSDLTGLVCKCHRDLKVDQPIPTSTNKFSPPHSPSTKLKPLVDHLKYAYLNDH
ncbi:hypothetical protein CR513_16312, partial [Mucuna pruriens]